MKSCRDSQVLSCRAKQLRFSSRMHDVMTQQELEVRLRHSSLLTHLCQSRGIGTATISSASCMCIAYVRVSGVCLACATTVRILAPTSGRQTAGIRPRKARIVVSSGSRGGGGLLQARWFIPMQDMFFATHRGKV
jgi:hypothetical protein